MTSDFAILNGDEYFADLVTQFNAAGKGSRIHLQTMSFDVRDPALTAVMEALLGAAKRGADVTLAIDAISFMNQDGRFGPLWYGRKISGKIPAFFEEKRQWLDKLNAEPTARAIIMNRPVRPFSLHIAGRTHIKAAIINDVVYIPCANLADAPFLNLALKFRDSAAAEWLYETLQTCADAGSVRGALQGRDIHHKLDDTTSLYLDAGVRNQSIIMDEALKLIDSAKKWLTITCQYFPGGITGQKLAAAAKRGVDVKVYFSPPKHHFGVVQPMNHVNMALARSRLPAQLFDHMIATELPKMHVKLIACDKGMMIGSHNFVSAGVKLGTAEIALCNRGRTLAESAQKHVEKLVQLSSSTP